jgi:hypothetical protein
LSVPAGKNTDTIRCLFFPCKKLPVKLPGKGDYVLASPALKSTMLPADAVIDERITGSGPFPAQRKNPTTKKNYKTHYIP